jgi:hypothetical protein
VEQDEQVLHLVDLGEAPAVRRGHRPTAVDPGPDLRMPAVEQPAAQVRRWRVELEH